MILQTGQNPQMLVGNFALGPVLFLLIIDSIGDIDPNLTISCFADDSKLFYTINCLEDAEYFQTCLDKLNLWQHENNMSFNNSKFQFVQYGRNIELRENYNYMSPDYSEVICCSEIVRDLGVNINITGNYNNHIEIIHKKAKQRINMILRTFTNRSLEFMKFSWKTYV